MGINIFFRKFTNCIKIVALATLCAKRAPNFKRIVHKI